MATPILPLQAISPIIVSRVSAAFEYVGGDRTDRRVVDEHGQPITRIRGIGYVLGAVQEITLEAPDSVAEGISEGQVVIAEGNLRAVLRGGDFGAITVKVVGVERVSAVSTGAEVFQGLDKQIRSASQSASQGK